MLCDEGKRLIRAITCSPKHEYFRIDDPAAHNIIKIANPENAMSQHSELRSTLENFGIKTRHFLSIPILLETN